MNVILLGSPGAGKGTQGALLAERLGIPKVATGDLLRAAVRDGTELGRGARSYLERGLLVPDSIVVALLGDLLRSPETADGIIMDGFPRTLPQAEAVDQALAARDRRVDRVLCFEVGEEELLRRLLGRARTEKRGDDTPETIRSRLAVYREQTAPLVARYRERSLLTTVDGTGSIEEIAERVRAALDR